MATLVVVPTLNEGRNIARVIDELLDGTPEGTRLLVVDGGSTDGTVEAAQSCGRPEVEVLHNPLRLQSAAVNLAAKSARPDEDVIVRADAHCAYPPGFVAQVTSSLRDRIPDSCVSVVVPMLTVGGPPLQRAIAGAQNSRLGNGGSAHRLPGKSGWIDHGHHAAMVVEAMLAVGGYREDMPANEDAELDERLRAAGGRIWMDAEAEILYYPRPSLDRLARQYAAYGRGRAETILLHRVAPKVRQVVPLVITVGNGGALLLSLRRPRALVVPAAYSALCLGLAAREAHVQRDIALIGIAPAAAVMHHAWGYGFLRRMLTQATRRG